MMKRVTSSFVPALVALVALFFAGTSQAAVITVSYVNGQVSTTSNFTTATTTAVNLANPVPILPNQFFRFGLALQVTGNPNPEAGTAWDSANQTVNGAPAMPANLGIAAIGIVVGSSDVGGGLAAPLINTSPAGKTRLAFNNTGFTWAVSDLGDVSGGIAGSPSSIFRGNGPPDVSTAGGVNSLGFYSALANLFNTLPYGTTGSFDPNSPVVLSPSIKLTDTLIWKRTVAGVDDGEGGITSNPEFQGTALNIGGGDSIVLPVANGGTIILGVIPEPASMGLMGLAMFGLLARRRIA
jgi:hypothetical protein